MKNANILNEFIQHIKEISIDNSLSYFIDLSLLDAALAKKANDILETDYLTIRCYDKDEFLINDIIIHNAFELMTLIRSSDYSRMYALYSIRIDLKK